MESGGSGMQGVRVASLASPPVAPGLLLALGEESPGDEAALLLSLGHFDGANLYRIDILQRPVDGRQAGRSGNQAGEPQNLILPFRAFGDHAANKPFLAAGAAKFGTLSAKIE